MYLLRNGSQIASVAILLALACATGCSTLPSSGIDPSGESVFSGPPPKNPFSCLTGNSDADTSYGAPYSPYANSQATSTQNDNSSCFNLFSSTSRAQNHDDYPTERLKWDNRGIVLKPGRTVAPVGSQVIIIAGVIAPDNYLSMNERVEWSLTSESVGQFVEVEPDTWTDLFLFDFTRPRKISSFEAVTSTSRSNLNLNRGTPITTDDIKIRRGETWVAVSSPVEGTSFVNAFAPSVYGWHARERTAMIHWVDVEWQFPAPSFGPAGGHQTLTTKLTRNSDHRPLSGWRVRYTVTGGPAAGFTPNGARAIEVVTNQNGEAIVELAEEQAVAGTNQVCIDIVRPDGVGCGGGVEGSAITVGQGSTMVTWSAPELSLTKIGAPSVGIGTTLTYQINVTNPGDLPTDDVQITDEIPPGAELIDSTPPGQLVGSSLQWQIGRLAPRETRTVQVRLRATQPGTMSSCAEATAVGGLTATGCVTTQVGSPKLEVKTVGPPDARVGDTVLFEIYVRNLSQVPATNLTITDRFDEGLVSEVPSAMENREIKKGLNDIQPGQTSRIEVKFRTTRTGNLCHEVKVIDSNGNSFSARGCVDVTPAVPASPDTSTGMTGPAFPDNTPASPTPSPSNLTGNYGTPPRELARPQIQIEKTGPAQATVGEEVLFKISVQNVGQVELTNLVIVDSYDPQLVPQGATKGHETNPGTNSVTWKLTSLPPMKQMVYEIKCKAQGPVGRACNRASVTTDQNVEDTSDAYINIGPSTPTGTEGTAGGSGSGLGGTGLSPSQPSGGSRQQGTLAIKIFDDRDAVPAGKYVNYEILVTNQGTLPDRNLTLTIDVSSNLMPIGIGTGGAAKASISGQTIAFAPVTEILPGATLSYRVRVQANSPGSANVRASLSSQTVARLEATETTEVTAAQ